MDLKLVKHLHLFTSIHLQSRGFLRRIFTSIDNWEKQYILYKQPRTRNTQTVTFCETHESLLITHDAFAAVHKHKQVKCVEKKTLKASRSNNEIAWWAETTIAEWEQPAAERKELEMLSVLLQ